MTHESFLSKTKRRIFRIVRKITTAITQIQRNIILRRLIKGKRVLVVASGHSASDIPNQIPKDILIFACNTSPALLKNTNRKHIDLYLTNKRFGIQPERRDQILEILSNFTVNIFLFRNTRIAKKYIHRIKCSKILQDRSLRLKGYYYLKKIIYPLAIEDVVDSSVKKSTTAGVALLQYAIYYGAKEVYLLGVDLDGKVRVSDTDDREDYAREYEKLHKNIDHAVIQVIAKKYGNVYLASDRSALKGYIPYKRLG